MKFGMLIMTLAALTKKAKPVLSFKNVHCQTIAATFKQLLKKKKKKKIKMSNKTNRYMDLEDDAISIHADEDLLNWVREEVEAKMKDKELDEDDDEDAIKIHVEEELLNWALRERKEWEDDLRRKLEAKKVRKGKDKNKGKGKGKGNKGTGRK